MVRRHLGTLFDITSDLIIGEILMLQPLTENATTLCHSKLRASQVVLHAGRATIGKQWKARNKNYIARQSHHKRQGPTAGDVEDKWRLRLNWAP